MKVQVDVGEPGIENLRPDQSLGQQVAGRTRLVADIDAQGAVTAGVQAVQGGDLVEFTDQGRTVRIFHRLNDDVDFFGRIPVSLVPGDEFGEFQAVVRGGDLVGVLAGGEMKSGLESDQSGNGDIAVEGRVNLDDGNIPFFKRSAGDMGFQNGKPAEALDNLQACFGIDDLRRRDDALVRFGRRMRRGGDRLDPDDRNRLFLLQVFVADPGLDRCQIRIREAFGRQAVCGKLPQRSQDIDEIAIVFFAFELDFDEQAFQSVPPAAVKKAGDGHLHGFENRKSQSSGGRLAVCLLPTDFELGSPGGPILENDGDRARLPLPRGMNHGQNVARGG